MSLDTFKPYIITHELMSPTIFTQRGCRPKRRNPRPRKIGLRENLLRLRLVTTQTLIPLIVGLSVAVTILERAAIEKLAILHMCAIGR